MKIEIKVPQLPESVSEATLLSWHKNIGEMVKREEILIDLETDKVVLELPAPHDGVLTEIIVPNGQTVVSGQLIAYFDTEVKSISETAITESIIEKSITPSQIISKTDNKYSNILMPSANKIAKENNLDTSMMVGSGRGDRILKEDIIKQLPITGKRFEERVPMTRLRKKIAQRLLESQHNNAILTTFNEVNMQPIMDLRVKYKDIFEKKHGVKLGFTSFFVAAVISALKSYPVLNASIDGDDIIYHSFFDIGIAVSSPRGLVVPILRNAENMSLAEIEQKVVELGTKAKNGKLELEELTGGTFSITNGGIFGSMMSTPIINPPQSAILGLHAIKERAVVENKQIVIRPMMYLALSYDHRLIDGKEAVSSLVLMKDALEDPHRLLLNI